MEASVGMVFACLLLLVSVQDSYSNSLKQQLGQMMFLTIRYGEDGRRLLKLDARTKRLLEEIQPGGVILFAQNVESIPQVQRLVSEIRQCMIIPPFIALDEEGGRVSRLQALHDRKMERVEPAMVLASRGNLAVQAAYAQIAGELAELGVNMNFAPVADIGFFPDMEYLGDRAFSANPQRVAECVALAIGALQSRGIVAVVKHFPGHGRADFDSHRTSQSIRASREELAEDLVPFRSAFVAGARSVMSAHVAYPALDASGRPASLSGEILGRLLRGEMGFSGIVITDALEMHGVQQGLSGSETAKLAIRAGTDMLMGAVDPLSVRNSVLADKTLEDRVRQSFLRIMLVKKAFGLISPVWPFGA